MVGNYKVITLCGSTRFKEQFLEAQKKLTLEGNIVISVGLFGHSGDDEVWTEGTKEMLDDMHKRKIDMADEIFVINVGGYIGSSTKSEIEYAKVHGKSVKYMEEDEDLRNNYIHAFTNLNCNRQLGQVAPHKAVMLISMIDMIDVGFMPENVLFINDKLERMFELNWKRYVGSSVLFKPIPATPFWHLGNESFWHLKRNDGTGVIVTGHTPSAGKLRSTGIIAELDAELFALLQNELERNKLRDLLIDTYLSIPKPKLMTVIPLFIGMVATRLFA